MSSKQLVDAPTLKRVFAGQTVRIKYPKWHFRVDLMAAILLFALAVSLAASFVADTIMAEAGSEGLFEQLKTLLALSAAIAFGTSFAKGLSRKRSIYEFSDSSLQQDFRNGKKSTISLNDVARVSSSTWTEGTKAWSSSGAQIHLTEGLPLYPVIRSFLFAEARLSRMGAAGERLIDLFNSALDTQGRIVFREHRARLHKAVGLIFILAMGAFMIVTALSIKSAPMHPWLMLLPLGVGAALVVFVCRTAWDEAKASHRLIILYTNGFDLRGEDGATRSVKWADVVDIEYPQTKGDELRVLTGDEHGRAIIHEDFRELYAIAYFIEHMRAEEMR